MKFLIPSLLIGMVATAQTTLNVPPPRPTQPQVQSTLAPIGPANSAVPPGQVAQPVPGQQPSQINTPTQATDLNNRIRTDMMSDANTAELVPRVQVYNTNGQVILRGQVPNRQAEQDLLNRVRNTNGVSSVTSELTVQDPALVR